MTRTPETPVVAAEEFVAELAESLTAPVRGECVLCYCARRVGQFGCDGSPRWARRWRDVVAPRATALLRRLSERGGFCDCEVFLNGWQLREDLLVVEVVSGELVLPEADPPCAGVRAGSSRPCPLWLPRRSGW